jgi:hypothetical protein
VWSDVLFDKVIHSSIWTPDRANIDSVGFPSVGSAFRRLVSFSQSFSGRRRVTRGVKASQRVRRSDAHPHAHLVILRKRLPGHRSS